MYRSTGLLIAINALMGLLALVGLGYSISVVAQDGKLCVDCLAIPVIWGWAAFGLTLGIAFVSLFAIIAAWRHVKSMLMFMSFFTFITFAVTVALTVIILMWSSAQDLGVLNPTILSLEDQFKSFLTSWAVTHPSDWDKLQDNLGCCGIDLKATYVVTSFQTDLHTGQACNATVNAAILSIQASTPDFQVLEADAVLLQSKNEEVIAANGGTGYFCESSVRAAAQGASVIIGVVLGLLAGVQLLSFILSCYLLCGVSKEAGGFAEVDEETGQLQSPLKAFIQAPSEIASDTKAFANRVSTRIGMNVGPVANRVSSRMGFSPIYSMPTDMPPISGPPPGLGGGGGGGGGDFGEKYAKYTKMKKSGLPEGAVRHAMERDGVDVPAGFFDGGDEVSGGGGGGPPKPPAGRPFGGPPPGLPQFQAMKSLANRVSMNMKTTTNRVSMNMKGMFGGSGFAPPPPPPGFGELPAQGTTNSFAGSSSFGGPTPNPSYGGPGKFSAQTVPEETFAAPALPAPSRPSAPAKPAKAAPAPKAPKAAPAPKKTAKKGGGGGGGGGAGFLADISGAGGASAFGLKKTVTNDRSGPNLDMR